MNRLANETSPYLRQHADNPVDWYPWGEEALARARREDKPILLSIGYSACHWCHVMAHESFEDPVVAQVMNQHFVNVKVDREERPDIDQIYQTAHQMLTQRSGGWPLTMFLAPDQVPFFGGTYFPKTPRHNLPGFVALMERVVEAWRTRRDTITDQNREVLAAFGRGDQADQPSPTSAFDARPIEDAIAHLAGRFDPRHGGFGGAPKFPHPTDIALCLRVDEQHARHMALVTLERMAEGGIYDHLGGGFARYSVDAQWMIPHFEKMLYDNGPLLALYTDAWRLSGDAAFAAVVQETAAWLEREMQSPDGGFYSSLDADSEGEEGKFYRWDRAEVENLLDADEYRLVAQYYGLAGAANFEGHYWHLHVIQPLAQAADRAALTLDEAHGVLASARVKLAAARERRIRPQRDDKILASWNALAITGLARAARVFGRGDWLASAERAMRFVREVLWRGGRLLATWKDGYAHLNAYLDDHAFLLEAALELVQARYDPDHIRFARELAEALLARFEDAALGGFFFTSHDHERLIHRPRQGYDGATPAGNAVAAFGLQRLGHLVGEPRYIAAAERAIGAFYGSIAAHPEAYGAFLAALAEALEPPRIVILRGEPAACAAWQRRLVRQFRPDTLLLSIAAGAEVTESTLAKPVPASGVNAYVCRGVSCLAPVDSPDELDRVLAARA